MRRLIAPLIRGIPATTHGPPASLDDASTRAPLLAGYASDRESLNFAMKPTACAINSIDFGADNLGETSTAIDCGALTKLIAAGRTSAAAVSIA